MRCLSVGWVGSVVMTTLSHSLIRFRGNAIRRRASLFRHNKVEETLAAFSIPAARKQNQSNHNYN